MHFIWEKRHNPKTQCEDNYYRIKESYRDRAGRVHCRILLNVGFLDGEYRPEEIGRIVQYLNYKYKHLNQQTLFKTPAYSEHVVKKGEELWEKILANGSIDYIKNDIKASEEKARKLVDVETIEHTDARDVGAEWICLQAIRELGIDKFLEDEGWSEIKVRTTLAHLIVRTIYTPSELKSMRIMDENSSVCELLTGEPTWRPGYHAVYDVAPSLYELKDKLENHLCKRTDDLFNITNRIVIFDLTNFYFEGRKVNCSKALYGRSKEKRSDCRLLVLALCINKEGFIRYSSILSGNTADPDSLPNMIDTIHAKTRVPNDSNSNVLVCIDAGIATEDNLVKIRSKGYNYLCVSRRKLKDYKLSTDTKTVTVYDSKNQPIALTQVSHEEGEDYYLEIKSQAKRMKEESMNRNFKQRFEEEMAKIQDSLGKKGGKKNYEKVVERVGRAIQKYPSIAKYYSIDYERDTENVSNMKNIYWKIAIPKNVDKDSGVYFLRTNVATFDEKTTWDYYNLTREIECTNRQIKTDLNLRPVFHQTDDNSDAHLFLGLVSYWIVNTIRYKLKQTGMNHYWTEIVRIMSTQKAITTEGVNAIGEKVQMRQCSEPNKSATEIYERLKYRKVPFRKYKIEKLCSTQ